MENSQVSPLKFTKKYGLANIEVLAQREIIERWISEGFGALTIYQALLEQEKISSEYNYKTFVRALYRLPKSKDILSRRHKKKKKQEASDKPSVNTSKEVGSTPKVFKVATGDNI